VRQPPVHSRAHREEEEWGRRGGDMGGRHGRQGWRRGREGRRRSRGGAARARQKAAAEMTEQATGQSLGAGPPENRRQVLYWRLLARLFDHEEQATLESASLAVVEDIGLPPALLGPRASVDPIPPPPPQPA